MSPLKGGESVPTHEPAIQFSDSEWRQFEQALVWATQKHADQTRKTVKSYQGEPTPYISHLLQVSGLVLEYGGDKNQAIAGLLHDVVEDHKASLEEVRTYFGDDVATMVAACSDTDKQDKEEWWGRKRTYIDGMRHKSERSLLVSAADKLHNARAILKDVRETGPELFTIFKAGKAGTIWYYRALIDAYRESGTHPVLVDELNRVVTDIERLSYPDSSTARTPE